ncbi:MAG: hypothetical protein ACOC9O_04315 [Myxococcota bacterium]
MADPTNIIVHVFKTRGGGYRARAECSEAEARGPEKMRPEWAASEAIVELHAQLRRREPTVPIKTGSRS